MTIAKLRRTAIPEPERSEGRKEPRRSRGLQGSTPAQQFGVGFPAAKALSNLGAPDAHLAG